ncbi:MAG TPA: hypothetical protein VF815_34375 [Myxococcaceae bacterium]|jgi:hypothetical protein
MERLRTSGPSEGSSLETLHPLPGAPKLRELLATVTSPGVLPTEVEELIRALALPLAGNESPRDRADFLLSVLEIPQSSYLKGRDGRTLRVATVEALLALGYPYALEVPPEALEEARRDRVDNAPRKIPGMGFIAAAVAMITQLILFMPAILPILNGRRNTSPFLILVLLGLAWGPSLSTLFGGWQRWRGLQRMGLIAMTLGGTLWLAIFALLLTRYETIWGETLLSLASGLSLLTGAILLRNPEWLAQEKASSPTPAPPSPDTPTSGDPA